MRWLIASVALCLACITPVFAFASEESQLAEFASEVSAPDAADIRAGIESAERAEEEREEEVAGPAASQERKASALAYTELGGSDSAQLLNSVFSKQLAQLNADSARLITDATLERALGEFGAQIGTPSEDTVLLESASPVRTEDEDDELRKVDLSLADTGSDFEPKNALTEVSIAEAAADGIEVGDGEGLTITQAGASSAGTGDTFGDKNVFFHEVLPGSDTDLLVSPIAGGVELFDQLRSRESPEQLRFEVDLPVGAELRSTGAHTAEAVSADGSLLALFSAPNAIDAQGTPLEITMGVEGSSLVVDVPHRDADLAYPILVDPQAITDGFGWHWGNNLPVLNNEDTWKWSTTNASNFAHSTWCIYACWGGSQRGLFVSSVNANYGGEQYGQWYYPVPGQTTYIPSIYPTPSAVLNPFYRDNHGCSWENYKQPHDYNGVWTGSSWAWLETDRAQWYGNATMYTTGKMVVFGISSGGGVNIPCWRDIMVSSATIALDDPEAPSLNWVSGVPESEWVPDKKSFTISASYSDPGLGVYRAWLSPGQMAATPKSAGCTGLSESRCSPSWTAQFGVTADSFKEGEREVWISAEDPTGEVSSTYKGTTKVDRTPPEVTLGGQLAEATDETEGDAKDNTGVDRLPLPVYSLKIEATDGSNENATTKRSGVKSIELFLDGKGTPEKSWTNSPCASSCPMSQTYPLSLSTLTALAKHTLRVVVKDFAGNTPRERNIEFKYIPATGVKDEYVMQYFPLDDGTGNEEAEEQPRRPELAVNVMNGNLVYRERDVDIPGAAVDLEVERFYNSQLPESEDSEWGDGWTLGQTPTLEPEESESPPKEATMVRSSGIVQDDVELPTKTGEEEFDPQLQAVVTKEAGGAYEVADATGETDTALAFDSEGQVSELRTDSSASVEYDYEGGDLSALTVDDPATAGGTPGSELQEPFASHIYLRSFGGEDFGPGHLFSPQSVAIGPEGEVWVADTARGRIQEFDSKGEFVRQIGSAGTGDGQFRSPSSVATEPEGNLYVTDKYNSRIQEFSPSGEFIRKFGVYGTGNGQLNWPDGLAIGPGGNIWVADTANHRVQEFSPSGEFIRKFGSSGSGNGQFSFPAGIAVDPEGNVWVADTNHNRIQEFNAKGEFIRKFGAQGEGEGQFESPTGIAVGPEGEVWVADSKNDRVQEFNSTGGYLAQFGASGNNEGQFSEPKGVALDAQGNLWVADTGNDRVQELAGGEFLRQFGGEGSGPGHLAFPRGVATDAEGNVWVADTNHDRIQEFNSKGEFIRQFGGEGFGPGEFISPGDVAVDAEGNVWVIDTGNNRVQEFDSEGKFIRQFGSEGEEDGQFYSPQALAVDGEGNVWVADTENSRIQEFDSEGQFIRKFGSEVGEGEETWWAGCQKGDGDFCYPGGIAIGPEGEVWVADTGNNRLEEFSSTGGYIRKSGSKGEGEGQFESPADITVGPNEEVWVTDTQNDRIQEFGPKGEYLAQFGSSGGNEGQFSAPRGITVDAKGNVWASDTGNDRVQELAGGEFLRQVGGQESGPGHLSLPRSLATDAEGNVWVADTNRNRIQEFDSEGEFLRQFGNFGTGNGQFNSPVAIAIGPEGEVWVADSLNSRIQEFDPEGKFIRKFGSNGTGNGQLSAPQGVATDSEGNLWVVDAGNDRVQEFNSTGGYVRKFGSNGTGNGQFSAPQGIATDGAGNVWVVDTGNNRIQAFNSTGQFIRKFGAKGTSHGQFESPKGIAIDPDGHVWVADTANNRIQEFATDGEYLSSTGVSGFDEGQLSGPSGIAIDVIGNIWVADQGNNRVQEWAHRDPPPIEPDASVEVSTSASLVNSVEGDEAGEHDYDHEGDLLVAHEAPNGDYDYAYDGAGRMTEVKLPNGTWAKIAYETAGRVKSVQVAPEGANAKSTYFYYSDEPRRTTVDPDDKPQIKYDIGADGSVVESSNVQGPPTIDDIGGTLYDNRETPNPVEIGDYNLSTQAHSEEGIASIDVIANGNILVDEKTCEQDPETPETECKTVVNEWVTNTANWPPGIVYIEVLVTDSEGAVASERFWVNIPYTPPPDPEAEQVPQFADVLNFREEFGLDLDLNGDELAINDRVFDSINAWHNPQTPPGEVARATTERWGVPLRAVDAAELEYREWLYDVNTSRIDEWVEGTNPASYAGYYMDHKAGGIMRIGFTSAQAEQLASLKASLSLVGQERLQVYPTAPAHSYLQVMATSQSVMGALESNSTLANLVVNVEDDEAGKATRVGTSNVAQVEGILDQMLGTNAPVTVEYDPGEGELLGGRYRNGGRMRAGDYINSDAYAFGGIITGGPCTAGFGAQDKRPRSNGDEIVRLFLLTAGHCAAKTDGEVWRNTYDGDDEFPFADAGKSEVGRIARSAFQWLELGGVRTDGAAIRIHEGGIVPQAIYGWNGHPLPTKPPSRARKGNIVCYSGAISKEVACGKIVARSLDWQPEGAPMGLAGYWVIFPEGRRPEKGDSGGPVWNLRTGASIGLVSARRKNMTETLVAPLLHPPNMPPDRVPGILHHQGMAPLQLKLGG